MAHSHKRVRKIGEAVFRGKKTQYKFDVFPLTADITDAPAVFIISRRVTDKFRKGHHSAVCLGETNSIRAEIKKHKRAKCVKQNSANVICILKDSDEANRSVVVDDLQTARSFSCIRNADQPNIKPKPNVKTTKNAPVAAAAPKHKKAVDVPVKPSKPAKAAVAAKPAAAPARTTRQVSRPAKKRPVKATAVRAKKAKKSQPERAVAPKATKAKQTKKPVKTMAAKPGKSKSSRAVVAKRPAAKRTISAAKPKHSAAPAKRKSAAKKPVAASPKRRTRVQGGVDSKRGQHRLSKPKKSADRRAKSRTAGRPGSGKKAAA